MENLSGLVAYGVDDDGECCLLAATLGSEESEASQTSLLERLLERVPSGAHV